VNDQYAVIRSHEARKQPRLLAATYTGRLATAHTAVTAWLGNEDLFPFSARIATTVVTSALVDGITAIRMQPSPLSRGRHGCSKARDVHHLALHLHQVGATTSASAAGATAPVSITTAL